MQAWWRRSREEALRSAHASESGLTIRQARDRLRHHGANTLREEQTASLVRSLLRRLGNPLIVVLLCASLLAAATGDALSFAVVAMMISLSVLLDMAQEHRAHRSVDLLRDRMALRVRCLRNGMPIDLPAVQVVPGDVVLLTAGDLVPADGVLLTASHLFVNQASLSGETFPVEKLPSDEASAQVNALSCPHALLMGSSVVSGSARLLVCATGMHTELGRVAGTLNEDSPPTAFEKGTRRFGYLLAHTTIALVLFVLLVNVLNERPLMESFLFAIALAVGLTPEMLPMIVSVTLAGGVVRLSKTGVIVKRLSAVQDLGAMDVLCTDKTGTLTQAQPCVETALGPDGLPNARVLELAWLNSRFETGLKSPLDDALLRQPGPFEAGWQKLDELPFDFERRRVSVLLQTGHCHVLIVKGAPEDILRLSTMVDTAEGPRPLDDASRRRIAESFDAHGARGLRLLAVATREAPQAGPGLSVNDERDLVFIGFVAFADPPKPTAGPTLASLAAQGVAVKIITGDTEAVTRHLCETLGFAITGVLTGERIAALDDAALRVVAEQANVFCRVTPHHKQRIVQALQAAGHVVGYLGDGINDAPSIRVADVGISVDSAVEVARQSADLVLLKQDLGILGNGIREGRRSFINVDKYIRMATSSNFGNMVSMAAASLFLPFLPIRPLQILLNNFMYDLSELPIPTDRVDEAQLQSPQRWDAKRVRRFMIVFGLLSSAFDLAAFALFYRVLQVPAATFQTAWFVQSLATQVLVIFLIRTPRAAWSDRPSIWLAASSVAVVAAAVALPYTPWQSVFGFTPLAWPMLAAIAALTLGYLTLVELVKRLLAD